MKNTVKPEVLSKLIWPLSLTILIGIGILACQPGSHSRCISALKKSSLTFLLEEPLWIGKHTGSPRLARRIQM